MRKLFLLLLVLAVFVGAAVALSPDKKEPQVNNIEYEATNFVQKGTLVFPNKENRGQDTPYLSYVSSPGLPTTTIELPIDEETVCATPTGALPCMAMSVQYSIPFEGKTAVVEAVEKDAKLAVKVIRVIDENSPLLTPGPGVTYIPWARAVQLIQSCQPKMIMQAHNLNVGLTLEGDRVVYAVEPIIDEVFKIVQGTTGCPNIPLATE